MNIMTANNGNELDLESFNAAVGKGVIRYVEAAQGSGLGTHKAAILVNTETGEASYTEPNLYNEMITTRDKGPSFIQLMPFPSMERVQAVQQELVENAIEGGYDTRLGYSMRLGAVQNWAKELGLSEDKLQDMYKEKVKEHEQEAERE